MVTQNLLPAVAPAEAYRRLVPLMSANSACPPEEARARRTSDDGRDGWPAHVLVGVGCVADKSACCLCQRGC